jgi:hypothetical protein
MKRVILYLTIAGFITTISFAQTNRRAANPRQPAAAAVERTTPNSVNGSFTLEGKMVKVSHAYARLVKNEHDKTKQDVLILFTEKPIPRKFLADSEAAEADLMTLYDRSKKGLVRGFHLRIDPEKRINSFRIYSGGQPFSLGGGDFKPVAFTRSLVQGSVSKQDKFFDEPYGFEGTFKVAVRGTDWTGEFLIVAPTNLDLGKASGQLVVDGKAIKLNYVYARTDYNFFDEKKNNTLLLFTETPVADVSVEAVGVTGLQKIKEAGNRYVVKYEITNEEGAMTTADIWEVGALSDDSSAMSATTIFRPEIDLLKNNDTVVEGRLYTAVPVKWFDHTYELNVAFHAPVKGDAEKAPVTAKNGVKLPVGGGAPGAAYMKFTKALEAAKTARELVSVMQVSLTASLIEEMQPSPNAGPVPKELEEFAFQLLKAQVIERAQVTGGFISGDKATIAVVGMQKPLGADKTAKSEKILARFNMHLENGQWKRGFGSIKMDQ